MKTKIITEFVKIEALQTTTEDQLLEKADVINQFIQKQDGFIDAELIKPLEGNIWYFIYHIENIEKLKAVGQKLRAMKLFDEIFPLIKPGSMNVSFYQQIKNW
jgi:antibiotic biosynthesis monooxygenase (ABM) superfamily enzyme